MGVLQRIALAYLVAAAVVLVLRPRGQVVAAAVMLLGYWALLRWVPVPGHPAGLLTPAGNLPGWVDRTVLGSTHMYQSGTVGYDPEGLLGTIPAAAGVLIGYWAGRLLRSAAARSLTVLALAAAGVGAIALGRLWSHLLPINKRMWTPSFVVLMSGIAILALAVAHLAVDTPHPWAQRACLPLRVLGANALVVYAGSELTGSALGAMTHHVPGIRAAPFTYWVWWRWLEPAFGGRIGNVVWAATVLGAWWLVAAVMWRRRWFVRA
jgi:predicted acyltransferase